MFKKFIQVTSILILAGFSFFYTEKVTKIARNSDPIMIKINEIKDSMEVSNIEPIIIDDEYIAGVNGCAVDVEKSYSKMKSAGGYKEELLVMSEINNSKNIRNKYIISGNKKIKNISIIFIIKKEINDNLISYLNSKKIKANLFVDSIYLEKNLIEIRDLSKSHSIYYYGKNGVYDEKDMIYNNNLINVNSQNESKYCLVSDKDDDILKLCTDYDMNTIKSKFMSEDILKSVKQELSNGSIMVFDSNDIENIKVSINYILSKGYNIVSLDDLLSESKECK